MSNNDIIKYFEQKLSPIMENISKIFELDSKSTAYIIKKIFKCLCDDSFFEVKGTEQLDEMFNLKNLNQLKGLLLSLDLNMEQIKKIVIKKPQIILFSYRVSDVYPIFKNLDFKGYALLNQNEFKSYSFFEDYEIDNDINKDYDDYNYVVTQMLDQLSREDIMKNLNLNPDMSLQEKFQHLVKDYSKKNYYFKR